VTSSASDGADATTSLACSAHSQYQTISDFFLNTKPRNNTLPFVLEEPRKSRPRLMSRTTSLSRIVVANRSRQSHNFQPQRLDRKIRSWNKLLFRSLIFLSFDKHGSPKSLNDLDKIFVTVNCKSLLSLQQQFYSDPL